MIVSTLPPPDMVGNPRGSSRVNLEATGLWSSTHSMFVTERTDFGQPLPALHSVAECPAVEKL